MSIYLQHLKTKTYRHRYLVLEVKNSIDWALNDKNVKKNKKVTEKLLVLKKVMKKFKTAYRSNQDLDTKTYMITKWVKNEAYRLLINI